MIKSIQKNLLRMGAITATAAAMLLPAPEARAQDALMATVTTFGMNFCPRGWMPTHGQLLPISSYTALFSLLGTIYGGDGRTTFALPDTRGRSIVGEGAGPGLPTVTIGEKAGNTQFTVLTANMPSHNHLINVTSGIANQEGPANDIFGASSTNTTSKDIYTYSDLASNSQMRSDALSNTGGGQPVSHRSPMIGMINCIAVEGVYPPRN